MDRATPVFAYLAHTLRVGQLEIPYAVVAGVELERLDPALPAIRDDQIWLNAWASEGLGARAGDTLTVSYDAWDALARFVTRGELTVVSPAVNASGLSRPLRRRSRFRQHVAYLGPSFPVLERITPPRGL